MNDKSNFISYLEIHLPQSIGLKDFTNLIFSLFCTLDFLPERLQKIKLDKQVLAEIFADISKEKKVEGNLENKNLIDYKFWIKTIDANLLNGIEPDIENARLLLTKRDNSNE